MKVPGTFIFFSTFPFPYIDISLSLFCQHQASLSASATVAEPALKAHLKHGDTVGACVVE